MRQLKDIVAVLADADPDDKRAIYDELGVNLTYHPDGSMHVGRRSAVYSGLVSEGGLAAGGNSPTHTIRLARSVTRGGVSPGLCWLAAFRRPRASTPVADVEGTNRSVPWPPPPGVWGPDLGIVRERAGRPLPGDRRPRAALIVDLREGPLTGDVVDDDGRGRRRH